MKSEINTRAKVGGEIGINGEYYEGGQFLPSSPFTIKGEHKSEKTKSAKTHKIEIEPYNWIEANEDEKSIFSVYGAFIVYNHNDNTMKPTYNQKSYNYYNKTNEEIEKICNRFNNGERIL